MDKRLEDKQFEDIMSSLKGREIEDGPPERLWHKISDTVAQQERRPAWHFLTSPLAVRFSTGLAMCLVVVVSMAGVSEWRMRSEVNQYLNATFMNGLIESDSADDFSDFDLL